MPPTALRSELGEIVGREHVLQSTPAYERDGSSFRGLRGTAAAVVRPGSPAEVAALVRFAYRHELPIVPRGGGTGLSGGAIPRGGELVVSLERMSSVRSLDPALWRMEVEAGLTTRHVQRLAAENGLFFPPDPGAAEQSQIGGNIATNAGGPHALKYGNTGAWVTGLEAVVPPGNIVRLGGLVRKDVAAYDLKAAMVGSEGTLGIVTAVNLRLIPRPEARATVLAAYPDTMSGCAAVLNVMASGIVPAALDYLDAATIAIVRGAIPGPEVSGFVLIAEVDGTEGEVAAARAELVEALDTDARAIHSPDRDELWAWREGVAWGVAAHRGGKLSEDVVVPVEHLATAVDEVVAIAARHELQGCSWGHAGDGNLHATLLIDQTDQAELERAETAASEVFEMAERLGGSISGEHGVGLVKRGHLGSNWTARERELQVALKDAFDPRNLMNPGKKDVRGQLA
jgi:glycolate oxidase subunit GlcD